ncbi:MAG: 3-keto-disaccharide hydrolase [Pirellulaceae bacterium]
MMKVLSRSLVASIVFAICVVPAFAADDGWVSLFDGKSLKGWTQKNGTATYRVEDETIVGKTTEGSPNSFLCTDKDYGDFELQFEVKVADELNSGVQFRSRSIAERDNGRVHGPQVEIATNGTAGRVYGEALGTDWLSEQGDAAAQAAFKPGAWNKYRVRAVGKKIETWVNDVPTASFEDEKSNMMSGFIGLQVHGIGAGEGPYEVRWRNIKIKDLSKK